MFMSGAFTAIFIGVPLLILGSGLLIWARAIDRRASQARSWPTLPGRVVESDVETYRSALDRSDPQARYMTMYRPRVSYEYEVQGQRLVGNRIQLGAAIGTSSQAPAQAVAAKYSVGTSVSVHVDPSDPHSACLDPRAQGGKWIRIIGWVLIAVAAISVAATLAFVTALEGFVGNVEAG